MYAMRPKRGVHAVLVCVIMIVVTSFGQDVLPTDVVTNKLEQLGANVTTGIAQDSAQNVSLSDEITTTDESMNMTLEDQLMINETEECPKGSSLPCVTKCCPYGYILGKYDSCKKSNRRFIPQFTILLNGFNDTTPVNETETRGGYNLIVQNLCIGDRYRLDPLTEPADEFHLLYNGSLWLSETKPRPSMMASNQYCMEVFLMESGEEVLLPLVCFIHEEIVYKGTFHFVLYPIGLLVSVPFLLATFIVYTMLAELRNLHGKTLACYVLCLAVAYVLLAVVQLGGIKFSNEVCMSVAFSVQFAFIASFFWLNVLCFNTWRTVYYHEGDLSIRLHPSQERYYFLVYSIYAWSFTIILITITMVMNFSPTIPSSYIKPDLGIKRCFFGTDAAAIPYFYGPIGVLIVANFILFTMTAVKLVQDQRQKEMCIRSPMQTFKLCLTFFIMMGMNWVMELLFWAAGGPSFIWAVTDICNALQGVIIFAVFVMDDLIWELCHTKLVPMLTSCFPCCKERSSDHHDPAESVSHYDAVNGEVSTVYNFPVKDQEIEK